MIKKILKGFVVLIALAIVIIAISGISLSSTYVHEQLVRNYVGKRVFMVLGSRPSIAGMVGGGTGFLIKDNSGNPIVLTNRHVCLISTDGYMYTTKNSIVHKLKILKMSQTTDLCALEAPDVGLAPLSLAPSAVYGMTVAVLGHPHLMGLTLTKGEITGYSEPITLPVGKIKNDQSLFSDSNEKFITKEKCLAFKNRSIVPPEDSSEDHANICAESLLITRTTIIVAGGNSGSPVVDYLGRPCGIVVIRDPDYSNFAGIISLEDIKAFVKELEK